MIGQTVSHYRILEKLGEGGMGVVFKAEDIKLKRTVALKFLPADITDAQAKERFIHEAQAASALDHPRICTIYEIDETSDGRLFIAMAYCDGETLKRRIERERLSLEDAVNIVIQIGNGLAQTHKQGIVHRDIKPANIIITRDGYVKIVDFGLAKLSFATRITRTGTSMGTPVYMSPEQVTGQEVNHRTDIWSLGVILYELVTGQLPFSGDYEATVLHGIVNEEPAPPSQIEGSVPPQIETIITRALQKEADQRYQKMDQMLADLQRFRASLGAAKTDSEDDELTRVMRPEDEVRTVVQKPSKAPESEAKKAAVPVRRRRKRPLLVPMVLIIAALAAAALFWLRQERSLPSADGYLSVDSEPPGAEILLNQENTGQVTPALCGPLDRGSYELTLQSDGFEAWSGTLSISSADTVRHSVTLVPVKKKPIEDTPAPVSKGSLSVSSSPQGADIYLNGVKTGRRTPAVLSDLQAGEVEIELQKKGYVTASGKVNLAAGERLDYNRDLRREAVRPAVTYGALSVASTPPGAKIELDGASTSLVTPHTFDKIETGSHSVRLTLSGYEKKTLSARVTENHDTRISPSLTPLGPGEVRVTAVILEEGAQRPAVAEIFIDDQSHGQTPKKITIDAGEYGISAKLFGYSARNPSRRITVRPGREEHIKFEFIKD